MNPTRKLAAILSADVKGYSRLMSEDEEATVRTLTACRELMVTLIRQRRGRVVDSPGDNLLAEFGSVVDAVRSAVEIQRVLKARNAELPGGRKMEFRVGVNLGDVVVEGERLYGDGVNIAARLEGLAEGGGVCISGKVYDEVKNKLALGYEFLGEQQVKNIAEPVRAYRVRMEPEAAGAVTGERRAGTRRWQWTVLAAVVVLLAGAAAVAVWLRPWAPSVEVASEERMAFPLPEKPSIAVLPFANLSGDPEQEYFADGMTDDLITDLSKVSGLFVIARNSVFAYKGKPVKVRQVAEELGVRYVLEGSVRRAEGKIRINAQLIDATTGRHLWADRYDRDYKDIFALQDDIAGRIVSALSVKLTPGEKEQLARRYTDNLEAYDYYLRGEQSPHSFSTASGERFIPVLMYEKAIELDPKFARAFAGHAMANYYVWRWGYVTQIGRWIEARTKAFESVTKALALDAALPRAHSVLAQLRLLDGRYDEAIASAAKAVAIDPNNADSHVAQAFVLTKAGRHDEAAKAINKAYRLNPKAPPYYDFVLGIIQFGNRQYAQAIESLKKSRRGLRRADFFLWYSAPSYAHLGRLDEAKAEVEGILGYVPFENLMRLRRLGLYRLEEDIERYVAGFRKAGVPQLPYGYKGSEENKLTGEQIGVLLFGRTTTAIEIKSSQQFLVDRTREGRITVRGPLGSDSGTSRIEGDMVCDQLQAYGKSCGFVFLNPKGSPKRKNEYHLVSDLGIFQFSPVD